MFRLNYIVFYLYIPSNLFLFPKVIIFNLTTISTTCSVFSFVSYRKYVNNEVVYILILVHYYGTCI